MPIEEAGGAAVETAVEFAQTDAGAGIISAVCAMIICCFKPLRDAWKGLSGVTKAKIFMVIGTLIGTFDTIMDMIVVVDWFEDDNVWDAIPIAILICIVLPGIVAGLGVFYEDEFLSHPFSVRFLLYFVCFLGFGSSVMAILPWNQLNGENLGHYHFVRMFEIFVESIPAGALQIYILVKHRTYDLNLNTVSIFASILSLCVGIEEAMGKYLPPFDRVIFGMFAMSDFLFRVTTMSFFMKTFALAQWIVVPLVYSFEFVLFLIVAWGEIDKNDWCGMVFIFFWSFCLAIPSVSSSAAILSFNPEYSFLKYIEIFIRLIISFLFAIFSLLNEWETETALIIIISGTLSIVSTARISYILIYKDAELGLGRVAFIKIKSWRSSISR